MIRKPAVLAIAAALSLGRCEAVLAEVECRSREVAERRFTVCTVDLAEDRLRLFLRGDGRPFGGFRELSAWLEARGERLVFGMNAGMFHPGREPVGLLVADGEELAPLELASGRGNFFLLPNGVFAVTEKGAVIVESSEYPKLPGKVELATQSGPLLVRHGQIHPAFDPASKSRLIRNGVGVPAPGKALFVISESPVSFYEFATFFRDQLGCPDALYLDGTVSSLHAPALGRSDARASLGPIVAVTSSDEAKPDHVPSFLMDS